VRLIQALLGLTILKDKQKSKVGIKRIKITGDYGFAGNGGAEKYKDQSL
jgi:hypothetical protein